MVNKSCLENDRNRYLNEIKNKMIVQCIAAQTNIVVVDMVDGLHTLIKRPNFLIYNIYII